MSKLQILIIDNKTSYLEKLKLWFVDHEVVVENYDHLDLEKANSFDLIILSGGYQYHVVGNPDKFSKELALIKNSTKPILGICLGFELIGYAFGCQLELMKEKEKGELELRIVNPDPIVKGLASMNVYESHRWVITKPSKDLKVIAESKDGIEMIKHVSRPIYGFQFHPEIIVNQTQNDILKENVLDIIGKSA